MRRWAAFADPVFRHYTQESGLPNPVGTSLEEDGDGFLWIGTQGGLARWDGYRFRCYKPAADSGALPDGWITTLHTDPLGRLWLGTSGGGLARYDGDADRFIAYPAGAGGLSDVHVTAIADDGAGGLWIATTAGLDHLDPATGHVVALHHEADDPGSLPDDRVRALLRDRDGTLWIGTLGGLVRRSNDDGRFSAVPLASAGDSGVAVFSLFQDVAGRIWLGTLKHGAFVISARERELHPVVETAYDDPGLCNEWILSIGTGADGHIWLGTNGRGIVEVDPTGKGTRRIRHLPAEARTLANDTVYALHQDRAGGIWVGTSAGISRLETNGEAVLTVFGLAGRHRAALSGSDVTSLVQAADGRIWAGQFGGGIDILDPDRNCITTLAPDRTQPEGALPDAMVSAIAQWPTGDMFIGTGAGLYRADGAGVGVVRVELVDRARSGRIDAVAVAAGRLWLGSAEDGLWSLTPDAPSDAQHRGADPLTDRRIVCLTAGASRDLWIGTRSGLNRLDLDSRKVELIFAAPNDPHSLSSGYISSLILDRLGRLWVGTMGGGVHVLVAREAGRPLFRRIAPAQGLPDDNVDCLLEDAAGRVWVATDAGLAVIDPISFAVRALGRADGSPLSAYWVGSGAALSTGELLFGGAGSGVTVIRPDRFTSWDYRPPIVVTEMRIGGKAVTPGRFDGTLGGAKVLVRPEANSLGVEFSALDYSAPEKNRYRYRLHGFDKTWIDADATRRIAAYTNLRPGLYSLGLRGSNRNGTWSELTLAVPVRVLPAWYQTLSFRFGVAFGAVAGILALEQGRTAYLRRRQRELERQVAERTAELEESKRRMEVIAYHDPLTGLANRRQFAVELRKLTALADRSERYFALLLMDFDRFKTINDRLGHDAGDALLVEAARRLQLVVRSSDSVARLGGDEFAILIGELPGISPSDKAMIDAICGRVVGIFAEPIAFNGIEMRISASLGVALFSNRSGGSEALYKAADVALYEAKRSGRNTWRWHEATPALPVDFSSA